MTTTWGERPDKDTFSPRLSRPLSGRGSITENAATDSNRTTSPSFNAAPLEFPRTSRPRAFSPRRAPRPCRTIPRPEPFISVRELRSGAFYTGPSRRKPRGFRVSARKFEGSRAACVAVVLSRALAENAERLPRGARGTLLPLSSRPAGERGTESRLTMSDSSPTERSTAASLDTRLRGPAENRRVEPPFRTPPITGAATILPNRTETP